MARRWVGCAAHWRKAIGRQQASGRSIGAFRASAGVHPSRFFAWRRKLSLRAAPATPAGGPATVPSVFIELAAPEWANGSGVFLELADGWRLGLARDFDAEALKRRLPILREAARCSG
jgi:hypothetical protein